MIDKRENTNKYIRTDESLANQPADSGLQNKSLLQSKSAQERTFMASKFQAANSNETTDRFIAKNNILGYGLENKASLSNDRKLGHRIYRLTGYTTRDKINRRFRQQKNQRRLRNLLTTLLIVIVVIILFVIYNPFKDTEELRKITGMDSLFGNESTETLTEDGLPDISP